MRTYHLLMLTEAIDAPISTRTAAMYPHIHRMSPPAPRVTLEKYGKQVLQQPQQGRSVMTRKQRPHDAFSFAAGAGTTLLLWVGTGIAGSAALALGFLCIMQGWVAVGIWLVLLLPGLVIGSGQCLILRTRCAAEGSVAWLLSSVGGDLVLLALAVPPDALLDGARFAAIPGLLLGALQFWELDRRFRGGDWWVVLSAVSYALGYLLARLGSEAVRWGTNGALLLLFPCIALCTGSALLVMTQNPKTH
jgi:hypothetical protein